MAEIAREVGRAPSTLHGWAAAGGWRLEEIEMEGFAPQKRDRASAACPASPDKARSEGPDGPEHQEEDFSGARIEGSQGWGVGGSETDFPRVRAQCDAAKVRLAALLAPFDAKRRKASDLTPLAAARALHQKSADLASAGQVRAAEAAARLADRILRTEFHLSRIAGPTDASQEEKDAQEDAGMNDARAELWDRFNKIRKAKGLSVDPNPWR